MKHQLRIITAFFLLLISTLVHAGNIYMGPSLFVVDNQGNSSFRGFFPRLSFGYSFDFLDDMYLGAELFAVAATGTLDDNYSPPYQSAKSDRSYGVSVMPGFSINDRTMGYFRFGLLTSNFPGPNVYRSAAQWGVGLQTMLTANWDVRAEYNYVTYRTVANLGSIKSDQVGVGLVYKVL